MREVFWPRRVMVGMLAMVCNLFHLSSVAAQQAPLPSPLTLDQALAIADQAHPDRLLADAALEQARARYRQAGTMDNFRLDFTAELRAIDPAELAYYQDRNDSQARLNLSKQIYDFGHTSHTQEAAEAALASQQWRLREVRQLRRLEVMQRFFAVLLADQEYARDNEKLANAYVSYDKAANRLELGKTSDIEVLALESRYQQARQRQIASGHQQRITRSQLAISLNRPDDLPAELVAPDIEPQPVEQTLELWVERALRENLHLLSLRAEVKAARKRLQASEAAYNPVLRGELEAATYKRELGGRNPLSAALIFEVPLYTGNRSDAESAEQRALLQQKEAELAAYELQVRQQLLDIWMELERLHLQSQELQVTADYRDLYLDRSRTLYEMDMQTDLGDSMSQIADIQWRRSRNRYDILLLQARLKALVGELLPGEEMSQ